MGLKLLSMTTNDITMFEMFSVWKEQAEQYKNGEITKEEYDNWRYNYPQNNRKDKLWIK